MHRCAAMSRRAARHARPAATAAAIADPAADLVDIYMCAEREEAAYGQVYTGPCAAQPAPLTPALEAAEPETEIEL